MANFNLDLISHGLPKFVAKIETEQPLDTFLWDVLFGGPELKGTEGVDGVAYEWRKKNPTLAEEAIRGADPNRVNYKSNFNANYVIPNYYHNVDKVGLEDADMKTFGEDIETNVDSHDRVVRRFAEKVQGIRDSYKVAKEQMAADAIFTAKVVNESGEQTFPMTSSLLALSGANLTTKFLEVINKAYDAIRKQNKAFRATALIMNPDDAVKLVTANKDLIDKQTFALGKVAFGTENKGAVAFGNIQTPAGTITIYAYYGVGANGNNYIPQGKAILCGGKIGSPAYGRVQAFENGKPCYKVQSERMVAYETGEGDRRHYEVEYQTAPLPVITNIDGYGVLTSIS